MHQLAQKMQLQEKKKMLNYNVNIETVIDYAISKKISRPWSTLIEIHKYQQQQAISNYMTFKLIQQFNQCQVPPSSAGGGPYGAQP